MPQEYMGRTRDFNFGGAVKLHTRQSSLTKGSNVGRTAKMSGQLLQLIPLDVDSCSEEETFMAPLC